MMPMAKRISAPSSNCKPTTVAQPAGARPKMIFGGTPTIEGLSRIWAAYIGSDQRKFWVPCPSCGEYQVLSWTNVKWMNDSVHKHEVFGQARPESARYR